MFEQAPLPIQDLKTFAVVLQAIDAVFEHNQIEKFLREVKHKKLKVRDFQGVLDAGLLGADAPPCYAKLVQSDRGHIREEYLRRTEKKVDMALRRKFLTLYTNY